MTAPGPAPGKSKRAGLSDRLTPGQIQAVLDALGIPWRDCKSNKDGWIDLDIDDSVGLNFNSTCGINIFNGGFVDHYMMNKGEGSADIVKFAAMVRTGEADTTAVSDEDILDAISWIKNLLGIEKGVKPPELSGGAEFANTWLKNDNNYVRVPDDIWQSDLSASAKLVWMALFKRCGKGEIYSFPGIRRVAADTSMGINRVQRALSELKDAGVLFEKHRRSDKPPNRYPVCRPVSEINTALSKNTKASAKATDPVPKMNTACTQNEYRAVPKMNTELDTGNQNHESETKAKVENGKTPFHDALPFSLLFLTTAQTQAQRYDHYLSGSLSYEQVASFTSSPNGWNPYTGEHFDSRGYPAAWDEVLPPEPREMIRIESREADNGTSM